MANEKHIPKFGMVIDLSKCVACASCTVSCKQEHDKSIGNFNTWVETWDIGDYPSVRRASLPKLCNHCDNAPCIDVCPVGATYRDFGDTVVIETEKCIGCGACVGACPFSARHINEEKGKAEKCNYCISRSANGLLPACVENCITHARIFGDLNDPKSEVAKLLAAGTDSLKYKEFKLSGHTSYIGLEEMLSKPAKSGVHMGGFKGELKYSNFEDE